MATDSVREYLEARAKLDDQTRVTEAVINIVRDGAAALGNWRRVVVANVPGGGFPAELVMGHQSPAIDGHAWLSALRQGEIQAARPRRLRPHDRGVLEEQPVLAFNDRKDKTEEDEQEGMMHLFMGVVLALRNPRAHALLDDAPETALEYIALTSLLAKRVDEAKLVTRS